jgi:hypothetical protein
VRLLVWLCAAALGALELAAGLGDHASWLNPAAEGSLFKYMSGVAALIAASGAVGLAMRGRSVPRLVLAAALSYVAFDYALGLHQSFAADLDARALASFDWRTGLLVTNATLLAAVGFLLLVEIRVAPRRSALVAVGTALLAASLGARFVGGVLAAIGRLPAGEAKVVGEAAMHAFGLSAWMLVAAGLLSLARESARAPALWRGASRPIRGGPRRSASRA